MGCAGSDVTGQLWNLATHWFHSSRRATCPLLLVTRAAALVG
jgi:hypothetical protein